MCLGIGNRVRVCRRQVIRFDENMRIRREMPARGNRVLRLGILVCNVGKDVLSLQPVISSLQRKFFRNRDRVQLDIAAKRVLIRVACDALDVRIMKPHHVAPHGKYVRPGVFEFPIDAVNKGIVRIQLARIRRIDLLRTGNESQSDVRWNRSKSNAGATRK